MRSMPAPKIRGHKSADALITALAAKCMCSDANS